MSKRSSMKKSATSKYDFHYSDPDTPIVRVSASDLDGRYTVTKEFVSDPHHPVVLMNVKIAGDDAVLSRLKCYVLLAPHLDGGGEGNSARSIAVAGKRAVLAWKNGTSLALGVDCGFTRSSCGYVGTSDGYPGPLRPHEDGVAIRPGPARQHRRHGRGRRLPQPRVHRRHRASETAITPRSPA